MTKTRDEARADEAEAEVEAEFPREQRGEPSGPAVPINESGRLATLRAYEILDTPAELEFDDIASLAAHVAGTPWALISFIDETRQWIKAAQGLELRETARVVAFCAHVVAAGKPLYVPDAHLDRCFATNPLVTGLPYIRAYAGFPLIAEGGYVLGSLCVLDKQPREFDELQLDMLDRLSRQVMTALELRLRNKRLEAEQRELLASRQRLARANELSTMVTTAHNSFLLGQPLAEVYDRTLAHFVEISGSAFGFIGEVHRDDDATPYLQTHAFSNLAWDQASREWHAARGGPGIEMRNLQTLFGETLRTGKVVLSNDPSSDSRAHGLPPGHPILHAYLGLPVIRGNTLIGMIGLANRPGGYDEELAEFLQPLIATYGGLIEASRAEDQRRAATRKLEQALASLRKSNDELTSFLNLLSVGTVVVSPAGEVLYMSESSVALAGVVGEVEGRSWAEVLPVDGRAREALQACMTLPASERSCVGARLQLDSGTRYVEIDVRNDPRNDTQRIFFIYDRTELYERTREATNHAEHGLVGSSPAMLELYAAIDQVAAGNWTVLIQGETGTGKELIARAIHETSARRRGPFVPVNCASLSDTLLSSQLFGHVKGAFTGATHSQAGLFEAASGGTIFLDEIGDVSLTMQRALLRVLQERELTRVGETMPHKVDVRIIAATHRDITAMARCGEFREDLLYRIRIARIAVPPLRDRRSDIRLLVQSFLANDQITGGKRILGIDPVALERLEAHDWPGNVRELHGVIEHAIVRCREAWVRPWDLPGEFQAGRDPSQPAADELGADDERSRILEALRVAGGNRSKAAKLLGIARATLYRRLEALGLEPG